MIQSHSIASFISFADNHCYCHPALVLGEHIANMSDNEAKDSKPADSLEPITIRIRDQVRSLLRDWGGELMSGGRLLLSGFCDRAEATTRPLAWITGNWWDYLMYGRWAERWPTQLNCGRSEDGQSHLMNLPKNSCALLFYLFLLLEQNGEETYFKIKRSTKMQKVFETYANRKGINPDTIRFLLDGERIQPTDTPKMLEMEDQDQIDCRLEQNGGSF